SRLLSISGQHESQRLVRAEEHLFLLDAFGGLEEGRAQTAQAHARLTALSAELDRLRKLEQGKSQKIELYSFQLEEIERARLRPGEEEELKSERQRLKFAERLSQGADQAYEALYGADRSVVGVLGSVRLELEKLAELDPALKPLSDRAEEAGYALEDVGQELRGYSSQVVFDLRRQEEVEERLALISRLVRKYAHGQGIEAVLARAEDMARELESLKEMDLELARLEEEQAQARRELDQAAQELSRKRIEAAGRLAEAVRTELEELSLKGARFEVAVTRRPGPAGPEGQDQVEFLLSANPGENLRPLARVASGGELSRMILALKSVLARGGAVETVVFDEVDAGIGGRVAEVVGRKLQALAGQYQILCITHLPQIAAFGQTHFRVTKSMTGQRTVSRIETLDPQERVHELARMLGGATVTDKALAHAREMLAGAG
ncbi:MAG: DNA repair protein RecN, partial [Deltaproteobacteria bacterium]|nr:DNA repair protein RecN [Deltaproteobacteria bacterium]